MNVPKKAGEILIGLLKSKDNKLLFILNKPYSDRILISHAAIEPIRTSSAD